MHRLLSWFVCANLILAGFAPHRFASAHSPLIIGEVNWAGSSISSADEWIEIWNLADGPISLAGYQLIGASNEPITFHAQDVIQPQSAFLIANYSATDTKSALHHPPELVTTAVTLSNDTLHIALQDIQGVTIDEAGTGKTPAAGSSLGIKKSMIRAHFETAGTLSSSWTSATSSQGLDAGITDLGTPGVCDGCTALDLLPGIDDPIPTNPAPSEPPSNSSLATTTAAPETTASIVSPITDTVTPTTTIDEATSTVSEQPPPSTSYTGDLVESTSSSPLFQAESSSSSFSFSTQNDFIENTTTTNAQSEPTSTETLTVSDATQSTTTLSEFHPRLFRINPRPLNGQESIDLTGVYVTTTESLIGWKLTDEKSVIFTFTTDTTNLIFYPPHLTIHLPRSYLNNDGDLVALIDPSGATVDSYRYSSTKTDEVWIQSEVGIWKIWPEPPAALAPPVTVTHITQTISPETPNPTTTVHSVAVTTTTSTSLTHTPTSTRIATKTTIKKPAPLASTSNTKKIPPITPLPAQPKTKTTALSNNQTSSKKITTTKTNKKIAPSPILLPSLSMISEDLSTMRVQVRGIVGSIPGLLKSHQYILHTEDGRGLTVFGNSYQPSPPFGAVVSVQGTLRVEDMGATIQMKTIDRWKLIQQQQAVMPRIVDLVAPSTEDYWSLVDVTGTVQDVKKTLVQLDVDGLEVGIEIRPAIRYRSTRIKKGDTIRVRGIISPQTDGSIKIFPRAAEEITIISTAQPRANTTPPSSLASIPSWTPIGIAGVTLITAQGVQYVRRKREQQRLAASIVAAESFLLQPHDPHK